MADRVLKLRGRVLVVDDDQFIREFVSRSLGALGHSVAACADIDDALELVARDDPEVLLTDLRLERASGLELCARVLERNARVPVVVMTGYGDMETAIAAIRAGAFDFVNKPIDFEELDAILQRAIEHRRLLEDVHRLSERGAEEPPSFGMIGQSPAMQQLFALIHRLRDSDATVLIAGESGTGKELAAQALHQSSARASGPFVAVNCAAVPAHLLESELFGHVRGAFTDAKHAREGLLARANKGTILLDEIGELPIEMQPKLLRALQERRVRPVGSNVEVALDVRVLAATNRDLEAMVSEQRFREDLYYRINVIELRVPPLRVRGNDVLVLAQHFIDKIRARDGKPVRGLSPSAAACIMRYSWPGNVRELENSIERAFALARYDEIDVEDLPERVSSWNNRRVAASPIMLESTEAESSTLEDVERRHIEKALESAGGNKTHAAALLGISRRSLYRKLDRFGIRSANGRGASPDEDDAAPLAEPTGAGGGR